MLPNKDFYFTVVIEACEEGGYYAECPALPGCHVQGESYEETLSEMRAAIKVFLEDYQEDKQFFPTQEVSVTSLHVSLS